MMTKSQEADPLSEAAARLAQGNATEEDQSVLIEAIRSGAATLLTGASAVTIGGDVAESVIVTGSSNIVLVGTDSAALTRLLSAFPHSNFVAFYARSIASAIDILHYVSSADVQFLRKSLRSILWIVRTVVAAYYLDKDDLQINANTMVAMQIGDSVAKDYPGLQFVDPAIPFQTYRCVLVVKEWAHEAHCSPHVFALPVAKERIWAMLGAPRTFLTGETEIVGDIQRAAEIYRLLDGQPADVAVSIRKYFQERTSFRSFACWQIAYRDEPIGVLNIQSNRPDIFGGTDRLAEDVIGYIRPFCSVLGVLVQSLAATGEFSA